MGVESKKTETGPGVRIKRFRGMSWLGSEEPFPVFFFVR